VQLPHRIRFLVVDRVLECRRGSTALHENVTQRPFSRGISRDRPVMPGVLIIERWSGRGILAFKTAKVVPDIIHVFTLSPS